jgi:serine/threonine protein phosphatase PrpC
MNAKIQDTNAVSDYFDSLDSSLQLAANTIEQWQVLPRDIRHFSYFGRKNFDEFTDFLEQLYGASTLKISKLQADATALAYRLLHDKNWELGKLETLKTLLFEHSILVLPIIRAAHLYTQVSSSKTISPTTEAPEHGDLDQIRDTNYGPVYISETQGRRAYQEDSYLCLCETILATAPKQHFASLLAEHMRYLANTVHSKTSGSTACVAHYAPKDQLITVANVGDSRAVLFTIDASLNVQALSLTVDHKPEHFFELAIIEKAGGKVCQLGEGQAHRINGALALGRAFGDERYPVSKEPDLSQISLQDPRFAQKRCFLLLACDGAFENEPLDPFNYAELLEHSLKEDSSNKEKILANFAKTIRNCAYVYSGDNISVLFCELIKNNSNDEDLLLGVFDGHSIDGVSGLAFSTQLKNKLKQSLARDPRSLHPFLPYHQDKITGYLHPANILIFFINIFMRAIPYEALPKHKRITGPLKEHAQIGPEINFKEATLIFKEKKRKN